MLTLPEDMTNSSGRTIKVSHFDVQPEGTENRVIITGAQEDAFYEYGDSFDFIVTRSGSRRPKKRVIFWHYADESADHLTFPQQIRGRR
jgi:hypothetical protein